MEYMPKTQGLNSSSESFAETRKRASPNKNVQHHSENVQTLVALTDLRRVGISGTGKGKLGSTRVAIEGDNRAAWRVPDETDQTGSAQTDSGSE